MVQLTRLVLGFAVLSILSSVIIDPAGLITDVILLIGDFSGTNMEPVLAFYRGIQWEPAGKFAGDAYQLGRDFLQILMDHVRVPDSFLGKA